MDKNNYIIERLMVENAQLRVKLIEMEFELTQVRDLLTQTQTQKLDKNEEN